MEANQLLDTLGPPSTLQLSNFVTVQFRKSTKIEKCPASCILSTFWKGGAWAAGWAAGKKLWAAALSALLAAVQVTRIAFPCCSVPPPSPPPYPTCPPPCPTCPQAPPPPPPCQQPSNPGHQHTGWRLPRPLKPSQPFILQETCF